jgi:predicted dienelactone hydrolase
MAVAGQSYGKGVSFRDERIKAAIAMSPSPPKKLDPKPYASITIPVLLMTGTLDDSPIGGGGGAADRPKLFDLLTNTTRYLLVFEGGDHMVFSGRAADVLRGTVPGTGGDPAKDPEFQTFVKASTLAFFDAWLKSDDAARYWLSADDGAKATLGANGTWKQKVK